MSKLNIRNNKSNVNFWYLVGGRQPQQADYTLVTTIKLSSPWLSSNKPSDKSEEHLS